jgi:hypothetical protein
LAETLSVPSENHAIPKSASSKLQLDRLVHGRIQSILALSSRQKASGSSIERRYFSA